MPVSSISGSVPQHNTTAAFPSALTPHLREMGQRWADYAINFAILLQLSIAMNNIIPAIRA